MLTRKQHELLMFIHHRTLRDGVPPSFDEMKDALSLRSKSGIHRLITALEERGFIRRLAHRARAIEIIRLPENIPDRLAPRPREGFRPAVIEGDAPARPRDLRSARVETGAQTVPLIGRIAAGAPIEALQSADRSVAAPAGMIASHAEHFALEVAGDSMIEAGIHDGDIAVIRRQSSASNGEIVVALIDEHEATLKKLRRPGGGRIALEAANPAYETRIFGEDQVRIQGRLVGLMRIY